MNCWYKLTRLNLHALLQKNFKLLSCSIKKDLFIFLVMKTLFVTSQLTAYLCSVSGHPVNTYTCGMQSHPCGTGRASDLKISPVKALLSSPSRALSELNSHPSSLSLKAATASLPNTRQGDISDISGLQVPFFLHISCSMSQHHQSSYFTHYFHKPLIVAVLSFVWLLHAMECGTTLSAW